MFYVVRNFDDEYLTNRRAGKNDRYRARSGWSETIDDAKVFSTRAAATRSGKDNGEADFQVIEVSLNLGKIVNTIEYIEGEEEND